MFNVNYFCFIVCSAAILFSCTKNPAPTPVAPTVAPIVTPQGPKMISRHDTNTERLIVEASLDIPKTLKSKVKKTDQFIWEIQNDQGVVIAGMLEAVPSFPTVLTVKAKDLLKPVAEDSVLVFSARIVKNGDEHKPPFKGQLQVSVGMVLPKDQKEQEVVRPAVDPKILEQYEATHKSSGNIVLKIGSKFKSEFSAIL